MTFKYFVEFDEDGIKCFCTHKCGQGKDCEEYVVKLIKIGDRNLENEMAALETGIKKFKTEVEKTVKEMKKIKKFL